MPQPGDAMRRLRDRPYVLEHDDWRAAMYGVDLPSIEARPPTEPDDDDLGGDAA